jgi:EAL domain-containing protein (putative c-di-GMP-specific phosphodiesterase class I)
VTDGTGASPGRRDTHETPARQPRSVDDSHIQRVTDAVGRALHRQQPPMAATGWVTVLAVGLLLAASWTLTYLGGGTHTVLAHTFYLPIVVAAAAFGARGALVAAVLAGLIAGPLLPLDLAGGTPQSSLSWLTRTAVFALVGGTIGGLFTAIRRSYADALEAQLVHGLERETVAAPSADAEGRVAEVIEQGCFHPVFQPVYALADGRLRAVEALTRFDTEIGEPPDVWFDLARQCGREVELDLAAIEAALRTADAVLPEDVDLGLNCSPATICDDRLMALLAGCPSRGIILEITEHAMVDDYRQLEETLPALRARGVALAVDDTGAGFSSLRHILRLSPEIIKLDISLTQGLRHDPVRRTLAECLVRFASRTGSELFAEGIEDPADLAEWRDLGADAAQGYLLGRPGALPHASISPLIVAELDLVPSADERRAT